MNKKCLSLAFLIVAMLIGDRAVARLSAQIGKPTPGGLEIVRVIGCLKQPGGETWVLTSATAPIPSASTGTSATSLREAEGTLLGTKRFRLIGISAFVPESQKGHKVEVKGILIKDVKESRVNVTSLQTVTTTCTR